MNLDILQYIVDSVKFQNDTPEFTMPFKTDSGLSIGTVRLANPFGELHRVHVIVRSGGMEIDLRLSTEDADQLARDIMGQLHKLAQFDAKRKAEQRSTEQDAD